MGVAVLPRPDWIPFTQRSNCPFRQKGLIRMRRSWVDENGNIALRPGQRVLVRGNLDIPPDLLINELFIPPDSELIFQDRNAKFRVRDIRVQGAMRIGGPDCRLSKRIHFNFDTEEDVSDPDVRDQIYARAGLGLVVEPGGELEIFGKLYQRSWTRLAETAPAGSDTLRLAERVNWKPGMKVVVVTSARRDYPYTNQNEVRTIVAKPDSRTLVLNAPLKHLHYGGEEYQVEVGLLSRNIVFRTDKSVPARAPGFGGHIMIDGGEARISSIETIGLGQRNRLGRYPLHFHHLGDTQGESYLTDNSIRESNWRCAVIHRTDNAVISRNVAYKTFGHCFYLEDGVEEGNEISYNLAAGVRIMGPVDPVSLAKLAVPTQAGFTLNASKALTNPADRAAAGFYLPNGNNYVFGNAASGGFAGFAFPNLPAPIGGGESVPLEAPISFFDGNSVHSAGYFWPDSGCVYVGGVLEEVDVEGVPTLQYRSGRSFGSYLRQSEDQFTNTKTFLCSSGLVHWGHNSRVVNFEAWDVGLMAQLFGSASIRSALVAGHTGHTDHLKSRPANYYQRGFRFYDTDTRTIMRGVLFRGYHPDPNAGPYRSADSCALVSTSHSNEFTPQRMTATAEFFFADVDHSQRFCHDDRGTLSSRNFNINDTDGSISRVAGDGLPAGPRIVGAAYTDIWAMNKGCVRDDEWGLWICPQTGNRNVASIATHPNANVTVAMYKPNGVPLGDNWYSAKEFAAAQITGPSNSIWHHTFPGGTPASFKVHAKQVPDNSYVVYSFSLPTSASCSISASGWSEVGDLAALLSSSSAVYANDGGVCYIRIPPANQGHFRAEGLSVPYQTWPDYSDLSSFTVEII
jgi:hypothetical protein